ncbi:MAG: sigma-54 dependent transcriptional regulator [Desulfobacterales bacterium]|nr:sigma-54 dependent transcriptional regulator [Desulfobacterales bacterium]
MNRHCIHETLDDVMVVGSSAKMARVMRMVVKIAPSTLPVLITGPTGSGKEVIASLIHHMRDGPRLPFVDVNCAAIPESLVESLLFGHEKGIFTGASGRHEGYFGIAGKGTLFLDEIGELPLAQQAKLLRVIETREYRPLGGAVNFPFEGRIIAATHTDLEAMIDDRKFREDLFYRLNVLKLEVPPLSERRQDLPELVRFFRHRASPSVEFTDDAIKALASLEWPGNVRQLKNTIDKISLLADENPVTEKTIQAFTEGKRASPFDVLERLADEILTLECDNKVGEMEAALIRRSLALARGNKSQAARLLGVHRKVVERKFKSLSRCSADVK